MEETIKINSLEEIARKENRKTYDYIIKNYKDGSRHDFRIFISLPMHNRSDDDILDDIIKAEWSIKEIFPKANVIHNFVKYDDYSIDSERSKYNSERSFRISCLGKAIIKLADCDICLFLRDYKKSLGCSIEEDICDKYGISKLYLPDLKGKYNNIL